LTFKDFYAILSFMTPDRPLFSGYESDTGTDLARIEPAGEVKPVTEMDLDTATVVLQAIVDTHESTITDETPLDQIAGYSTEQIRLAEQVVAESLMESQGAEKQALGNPHIRKETPQGRLSLYSRDGSVYLKLNDKNTGNYILENEFATKEPKDSIDRTRPRFTDFRSGRADMTSLYGLGNNPSLAGVRHMIRGTRWMSANMLDWGNPNTIMPEQLDNRGLPTVPQGGLPETR